MKHVITFVAILILAAGATWYSLNPQFPVKEGLDLRGGMRVTLEPDLSKDPGIRIDRDTMNQVQGVLSTRVNSFGLSGAEVRLKGENQVLVLLPGARNPQEALETISKVAQLEFRHLANVQTDRNPGARYRMTVTPGNPAKQQPDQYTFTDTTTNKVVPHSEVIEGSELILKGNLLEPVSKANINPQTAEPMVEFQFKPEGAQRFANFTTENVGEVLAIVLDGEIISAPTIREPITEGHGTISGGFARMEEARVLANLLNSGALPVPLKPVETQTVGATLGQESIDKSLRAGMAGLGLVLVFMLAYYWLPGVLACIALLFYAALTFAIFKLLNVVLDLPGITGFILSVGMAVDANILIFERLKEELKAGKSIHAAIDAGFTRAFSAILDSNVTTWIVCAILVWLGAAIIKGFAITLAIGVAVSMFTAITVTRTMLHLAVDTGLARNPALYGLGVSWLGLFFPASKQGGILDVFSKRRIYLGFSILLAVLSAVFLAATPFGRGLQPGIDFTGGTIVEAAFREKGVTREQVEEAVRKAGVTDATISIGRQETPWTTVTIEATGVDPATQEILKDRLANHLRGFDPASYSATNPEKEKVVVKALFTSPVTEEDVRAALNRKTATDTVDLGLKNLKITLATESHTGDAAIPVALIQSRALQPDELKKVREELGKLGGGLVQPLYQENSIGPSVAAEIVRNAFLSVLAASVVIVLYLAGRFAIGGFVNGLKFGAGAVIALLHDVGIVLGLFALMGAVAGWHVDSLFVTAALTILGFSVHDTIVVYDRIRENLRHRRRDEPFALVSDRSITQTFDRSVNTSLTVLLVVAALVFFGGESIRLFNVALLVGIAIGTYSSIFVASPLVVMIEHWAARRRGEAVPVARPQRSATRPASARPRREPASAAAGGRAGGPARPVSGDGAASSSRAEETKRPAEGDRPAEGGRPADGGRAGTVRPRRKRRM